MEIHQDELGNNGQEDDAMIENNEEVSTGFHLDTYADACESPKKTKKKKKNWWITIHDVNISTKPSTPTSTIHFQDSTHPNISTSPSPSWSSRLKSSRASEVSNCCVAK